MQVVTGRLLERIYWESSNPTKDLPPGLNKPPKKRKATSDGLEQMAAIAAERNNILKSAIALEERKHHYEVERDKSFVELNQADAAIKMDALVTQKKKTRRELIVSVGGNSAWGLLKKQYPDPKSIRDKKAAGTASNEELEEPASQDSTMTHYDTAIEIYKLGHEIKVLKERVKNGGTM